MDRLTKLEVFSKIAETGSFYETARSLNLSRPTVTRLMAELEKDLNQKLLFRNTRRVSLTSAGESFLPRAGRFGQTEDMEWAFGYFPFSTTHKKIRRSLPHQYRDNVCEFQASRANRRISEVTSGSKDRAAAIGLSSAACSK